MAGMGHCLLVQKYNFLELSLFLRRANYTEPTKKIMNLPQSIKQIYREFMQSNFPELKLQLGLFNKWPHALRFDLQLETLDRDDVYFEEVQRRASALFEAVFDPADRTFFVMKDSRYRREKIRSTNYAFSQIDGLRKEEIVYWREHTPYDTHYRPLYNIALVSLAAGRINHRNILAAIGNQDFPTRKPILDKMGFITSKEIYCFS